MLLDKTIRTKLHVGANLQGAKMQQNNVFLKKNVLKYGFDSSVELRTRL